ncbi:MAG: Si-specific NAD(P)(+) transhydrogenase [Bdellovibrionales bacterium]|nr:Si-specific NAD(P)(+) transhydrogenase [Bdellovibrionales bacterium]
MAEKFDYDMVVIGGGPGGQKAAIQAAKLRKRVALVDVNPFIGGVCLHDGTIPSKSFREAILHLSGFRERFHYGKAYRVKQNVQMNDLTNRCRGIVNDIEQTIRSQMLRNHVDLVKGFGSIVDANHVRVTDENHERTLSTEFVVIGTGTRPRRPPGFQFDETTILDSDNILHMSQLPSTLTVVGGGVIGSEYGSMFAALDVKVTIVEAQDSILGFLDREIVENLVYKLRDLKATIITNDKVVSCGTCPDGRAVTYLESGKRIVSEKLLVSAGRVCNIEGLNLDVVSVEHDERGRIKVNEHYQTTCPNIYAVGDIIGFPALAATSLEQGRRASCHAFGLRDSSPDMPLPFGIFTVPEIGMVGKTEQQLSAEHVPYEVGVARFSEIEKGKIIGDDTGFLKIIFHRNTLEILGVHIIGHEATELVHIGQIVMGSQRTGGVEFLANNIFNYPSLAQAYKVAALDGLNKVIATQDLPDEVPKAEYDDNLN